MKRAAKEKRETKPAPRNRALHELISWFWVIVAFLLIQGTLVQARVIPSGSMEPTVLIGDHLLMSRIGYEVTVPFTDWHQRLWREPHRQQIIVFRAPPAALSAGAGSTDFIKRVIGLPGDTVQIRDSAVWVNGKRLIEPYVKGLMAQASCQFGCEGPVTVPPDSYYAMGDNRNDSSDSRYWGFVPRDNLEGTPILIYMSIRGPGETWEPGHIGDRVGAYLGILIHPGEVRWSRLFHLF